MVSIEPEHVFIATCRECGQTYLLTEDSADELLAYPCVICGGQLVRDVDLEEEGDPNVDYLINQPYTGPGK